MLYYIKCNLVQFFHMSSNVSCCFAFCWIMQKLVLITTEGSWSNEILWLSLEFWCPAVLTKIMIEVISGKVKFFSEERICFLPHTYTWTFDFLELMPCNVCDVTWLGEDRLVTAQVWVLRFFLKMTAEAVSLEAATIYSWVDYSWSTVELQPRQAMIVKWCQ